jgi:hypothetical protein
MIIAKKTEFVINSCILDELKLEWNQQITAVLVAGRSNSYLVAVNRNDLMLNIVTESNSDFVIMLQLDSYPTDFDSYEIFAEDSWTDSKIQINMNAHFEVILTRLCRPRCCSQAPHRSSSSRRPCRHMAHFGSTQA